MEIIPAIIPESFEELEEKISEISGLVDRVQIDVENGSLTPARSWPYQSGSKSDIFFGEIARQDRGFPGWENLDFEAHFMLNKPELFIDDWVAVGATAIIIQIEGARDLKKCLSAIGGRAEVGVSIGLETPIETVEQFAGEIKIIQLMAIRKIGFQGEMFDDAVLERVASLRQSHPKHIISVDGGVNLGNAPALRSAGADRLVIGSAIWSGGAVRRNLAKFKKLSA